MAGFSGSFPHDLLDLNDWRWQGPVKDDGSLGKEGDGKAVSVPSDEADTSKIEHYRDDPWFVLVTDGDAGPYVRLRSPAKGSTTSTSETTRSELREMHHPHAEKESSWDATGSKVHNLKVRLAITKVMERNGKRSRVAVAQVHKTKKFGIIVFFDGESGELKWKQESPSEKGSLGSYRLGDYVNIGLSVRDGKCKIYVDDVEKAEGKLVGDLAKTCYFKTGCYNQDNNRDDGYPKTAFNEVHVAAVKVQHGVAWAPGGYEPIGPGVGTQKSEHGSTPRDVIASIKDKRWKLNLDTDKDGEHTAAAGSLEIPAEDLAKGFVDPGHFEVVDGGAAVRFLSHLNGALTGNTGYPRTELREMKAGHPSQGAAWDISNDDDALRRLVAEVKVAHAPSTPNHQGVVIGQIHDTGNDHVKGRDILEIMYDGKKKAVGFRWDNGHGDATWQPERLIDHYEATEAMDEGWFSYRVEVRSGTVEIAVDTGNGFEVKARRSDVSEKDCFFKAGAYTQSSTSKQDDAKPHDYGEALFRSIVVDS